MNAAFNGERLKKARIYRGLTVAELADKIGCQRQTLSMYEISKSQPNSEIAKNIAQTLSFPIKYFYEYPDFNVSSTVYFRSLLTTSKKYRTEQVAKMEFISQIYNLLQDYVEFPKFEPIFISDSATPEDAAIELRKAWNLGNAPIDNIVSVVEQHGILVTSFNTGTDDIDAFSQFIDIAENPTYIIAYSSNKTSAARIHFDIAHELGHILLHGWSEDLEELSKEEFRAREQQAHNFAAAFLLPEETFKVDASSGPQTILYYKQLKKKWKVSIAAMIRRAMHLDVMSMDEYQSLMRTLQRRGQRKEEPLDNILITASPSLLKTSVLLLLQENVFDPKEFMDELANEYQLSINPSEVEYLLDLPSKTLALGNTVNFPQLQIKQSK